MFIFTFSSYQEIELHQKEQEELLKSNIELEQSVRSMLQDPKSNVRQQMFPEFFPSQEKLVFLLVSLC